MKARKQMKDLMDLSIMGAGAMQASTLLTTNRSNPANAIPGMVGIGVAGGIANAAFYVGKKKRRR